MTNYTRLFARGLTVVAMLAMGVSILACASRPVEKGIRLKTKTTAPEKTEDLKKDAEDDLK